MKNLKAFFLGRMLREKLLLVVFIALGTAIWLSSFSTRAARFWHEQSETRRTLVNQALWIGRRGEIETNAQKAISKLDPARTLSDTRLLGEANAIANNVGLRNFNSEDARTQTTSQFAVNSLRFTVRRASWEALKAFYTEVQKHSPYIGIEEFMVQADPGNPSSLSASFRVSSAEVLPSVAARKPRP